MIGITGSLVILLKWSGVLIIPFFILCTISCRYKPFLKDRVKEACIPLSILLITVTLLLFNNFLRLGHLLPDTSALAGRYIIKPAWYYLLNFHNILIVPFLWVLFAFGFFVIFKKRSPKHQLLAIWFLVFLTGISIAQGKDLRYSLLVLPSALLISCVGISALIEYAKTQKQRGWMEILVIIVLLGIYALLLTHTQRILNRNTATSIGFQEAGQWIKKESSSQTLILASSPRLIRYYSGINFKEFGGNILLLPMDQMIFQNTIEKFRGPVLLEIDYWEKIRQPRWLYPITDNTRQYMKNLGFQQVEVVEKEIYVTGEPKQMVPVAWIFKKQ
ncbi:MAG: hypothetical protein HQL12_07815 [Candidatus Omnitrophica bacterium]|nr:hypothetical protein [Candidatus Omnitrophota bacterium]